MDGWIKLHRGITEHWIWRDPIKLKWWLDILIVANHSDNKVNIGMELFDCDRGQTIMSLKNWATRWNVSRDTVRNFLVLLKNDGMILQENIGKSTRITICNYDAYQIGLHNEQTQTKREANANQTQSAANKNDKKEKNDKNNIESNKLDSSENGFSGDSDSFFENSSNDVLGGESDTSDTNTYNEQENPPQGKKEGKKIDFDTIVEMYHSNCPSFPKIFKLPDARKQKIRIRLEEMNFDFGVLETIFKTMEESKFLRGDNKNGWKASFDWVFANPKNWVKIIEGNYNNKTPMSDSTSNVNDIWDNQ